MKHHRWTVGATGLTLPLLLIHVFQGPSSDTEIEPHTAPATLDEVVEGLEQAGLGVRVSFDDLLHGRSIEDCFEHFRKAVEAGIVNVDPPAPEGCNGENVLWYARTVEELQVLIDGGADVNAQNHYGETPLDFVVAMNRPDLVKLLLDAGADPTPSFPSSPLVPLEVAEFHASTERELHGQILNRADVDSHQGFRISLEMP